MIFDDFKIFKSLAGRVRSLKLNGNFSDHIWFDKNLTHCNSWDLLVIARFFVKLYYKPFGKDFLTKQRHLLTKYQNRLLTFFLDISSRLLMDMSDDYKSNIYKVCEKLKIDSEPIIRNINAILPISDRTDIREFIARDLYTSPLITHMKNDFDDFKIFKSLAGRVQSLKLSGNFSDHIWFDKNLTHCNSWDLLVIARFFVKLYYKPFGKDFLTKQRHLLSNYQNRLLTFFLDISSRLLMEMSGDYESDIYDACEELKVESEPIIRSIHPILPISDRTDIWEFIAVNLHTSPLINLAVLTLSSVYDDIFALVGEEAKKEMAEIQRDFLSYLFKRTKREERGRVLSTALSIFETINKFKCEGKFLTTVHQIFGTIPKDGVGYVTWDKVSFFNGMYHIPQPSTKTGFYCVTDPRSKRAFNDLKPYFLKKIPPLCVKTKGGKIVKVINEEELYECITMLERKTLAPPKESTQKEVIQLSKTPKSLTKGEARELLSQYKSRFIDTLCNHQLESYKIVCCIENRINSNNIVSPEYAFIFTIRESCGLLTLAFENSEDSRCSYLFTVPKLSWQRSIDLIFDFFSSNSVNKRQAMAQGKIDLRLPGNYEYIRVMHNDYFKWLERIKYD